jgi:ABC-type transport system substrate-binding protein
LQPTGQNLGVVIKNYLAVIGINVDLNIVDTGRYYAMQFTEGWQGLFQTVAAISPEYSVAWLHHFGRAPDVKFASLGKSPEFLTLCDKNYQAKDISSMRTDRDMVTQASQMRW